MLASPIARVYAEALFAIAEESGQVEELGRELQGFLTLVRDSDEIEEFLSSPVIDPAVKVEHLKKALEGNASGTVADFLCLLTEKRRTQALPSIVGAYQNMAEPAREPRAGIGPDGHAALRRTARGDRVRAQGRAVQGSGDRIRSGAGHHGRGGRGDRRQGLRRKYPEPVERVPETDPKEWRL